jgi:hypothetical protein
MARASILFGCVIMVFGLSLGAPPVAHATGNIIRVSFNNSQSSGTQISGWLQYDDSEPPHSVCDFLFKSTDLLDHELSYTIGASTVSASDGGFSHYEIITSGNNRQIFQLKATLNNGTQIVVILPTLVQLPTTALPDCSLSSQTVFNPTPASGTSSFQITSAGVVRQFAITNVSCAPSPQIVVPSPQAPSVVVYASAPAPAPACAPSYACRPRPACCLSRLFCRGSFRLGCH